MHLFEILLAMVLEQIETLWVERDVKLLRFFRLPGLRWSYLGFYVIDVVIFSLFNIFSGGGTN